MRPLVGPGVHAGGERGVQLPSTSSRGRAGGSPRLRSSARQLRSPRPGRGHGARPACAAALLRPRLQGYLATRACSRLKYLLEAAAQGRRATRPAPPKGGGAPEENHPARLPVNESPSSNVRYAWYTPADTTLCPKFMESPLGQVIHLTYLLHLNFSLILFTKVSDLDVYYDHLGCIEAAIDQFL